MAPGAFFLLFVAATRWDRGRIEGLRIRRGRKIAQGLRVGQKPVAGPGQLLDHGSDQVRIGKPHPLQPVGVLHKHLAGLADRANQFIHAV